MAVRRYRSDALPGGRAFFRNGMEENIFPSSRSMESEADIEEERRLAYVAITRARRRCVISNAMTRFVFGTRTYNSPSRFITEMDNRYLDFQGGAPRTYAPTYTYTPPPKPKIKKQISMVGKLVSHDELGAGVVIEDGGAILTIAFKTRGIKKVARDFVKISE